MQPALVSIFWIKYAFSEASARFLKLLYGPAGLRGERKSGEGDALDGLEN